MTEFDPEDPRIFEEPFDNTLPPDEATDEDERPHETRGEDEDLLEGVTEAERPLQGDWSDMPSGDSGPA